MSDINLKMVIALARGYNAAFSEITKNIQGYGLSVSEFGVLEMLYHKGEQPVQKIAEKVLVTSGTITYVIDKLQKKNLVSRKNCEKDRRIFYVCLTNLGEQMISDIFPKHKAFLDNLFDSFSNDYKDRLIEDLFLLQDIIKRDRSE